MKVFVTGAAGYIGGSVSEKLIASGHEVVGLARTDSDAELLRGRGIEPVLGLLDDADVLTGAAQAADAVIHAANADHTASVVTLVTALERSGKLFIHTSGSSIVADNANGEFALEVPFSDDDYFEPVPYRRARVDMNRYVRQASIEKGVRAVCICPGMIYGTGRGLKADSDQLPKLIGLSKQLSAGVYFGKGLNRYSNVHIDDLVDLYLLVMEKAPGGSFFFAENGHASFFEIAEMISQALGFDGRTIGISVDDVARQYGEAARLGVASNSMISAMNARRLGWAPKAPSLEQYLKEISQV